MKTLHILLRTHSDYDQYDVEIVGVTDETMVAHAWLQVGAFGDYWSHEVEIVTFNVLAQEYRDRINEWLDPARNPLCECGCRLLHHRRANHKGSCKHNVNYGTKHKCKGFTLAEKQPPVYQGEEIQGRTA
jgi:hypothetical protein